MKQIFEEHWYLIIGTIFLIIAATMLAHSAELTYRWDAPKNNQDGTVCKDLAGYYVYINNQKVADTKLIQEYTMTNVQTCEVFCAEITAYDTSGNESFKSNTVCKSVIGAPTNNR